MNKFLNILGLTFAITIISLCVGILIYEQVHKSDLRYQNKTAVIVSMGQEDGTTKDKFHKPTIFHTLLIRDVQDTTLFAEWNTTQEKYYNYQVGDTVHFDYISKNRWFHIKQRNK